MKVLKRVDTNWTRRGLTGRDGVVGDTARVEQCRTRFRHLNNQLCTAVLKSRSLQMYHILHVGTISYLESLRILRIRIEQQIVNWELNIILLIILYLLLIRSRFDFVLIIWLGEYESILPELGNIQKAFLRYIYFRKYHIRPDYNVVRTAQLRI